jgi:hypothetical protein
MVDPAATGDLVRMGFRMLGGTNVSLAVSIEAEAGDEIFIRAATINFRLQKGVFKAANPKSFSEDLEW